MPTDRRRLLVDGGALLAGATASRATFAQAQEYAVFQNLRAIDNAMARIAARRL